MAKGKWVVGTDVGGTFTDIIGINMETGEQKIGKVSTTPPTYYEGIMNGLKRADLAGPETRSFRHGATVSTNAVEERKGVKTALITTEGFRDVLHIMRQDRPKLYDFFARRPDALIPRYLRFEVPERIDYRGRVHRELDQSAVTRITRTLRREKVAAVAVCLLHSYSNPAHERRVREIVSELASRSLSE